MQFSRLLKLSTILNNHWHLRVAQVACFALAGILAFLLRFEFHVPARYVPYLWTALAIWVVTKQIVFYFFRLHRGWWRYVSIHDLMRLGLANVTASVVSGAVILLAGLTDFPRSLYILDGILCFGLTAGLRMVIRAVYEMGRDRVTRTDSRRTLIYGAGDAGVALLREIRYNPGLLYQPIGFIDDDPGKRGLEVMGMKVLGPGDDLTAIVKRHDIGCVLIALPSASGRQMTRILQRCSEAEVDHKTVPGMAEIIEGDSIASQIRDVAVEDLLGRDSVQLDTLRIEERYSGKVVMVTGAAGSIGSELCRQLARFHPAAIVGYEVAETPLFLLERELAERFPSIPFRAEIGCIKDVERLQQVFEEHSPAIVFHAAAYKHVPMMEKHVFAAVQNNVFGTHNVAMAAAMFGVEEFVLISTDKAVRPTSVMGATKRLAELTVKSLSEDVRTAEVDRIRASVEQAGNAIRDLYTPERVAADRMEAAAFAKSPTKFVSVRFGNVLGSNGSVIPIFKNQIASGGPVKVTHPEMRRYFMTIPEASQLVIQASTMGKGGEIFVLDMGEPVKIVDLARNLIVLSGLKPDEDIRIEFTGMRPGEKLYEELTSADEEHLPTEHEKILIFSGNGISPGSMRAYLDELQEICLTRDISELVLLLKEVIPEYNPSGELIKETFSALPESGAYPVLIPGPKRVGK